MKYARALRAVAAATAFLGFAFSLTAATPCLIDHHLPSHPSTSVTQLVDPTKDVHATIPKLIFKDESLTSCSYRPTDSAYAARGGATVFVSTPTYIS